LNEPLILALSDAGAAPVIHPGAYLAPMTTVIGDVELDDGVNVWFGTVIRGDSERITVGQDCNIQDTCVLHSDPGFPITLGMRVSLGHGAIVHGASVEDDCLIGMRAVVLNGAVVGRGSLVAAGAVVRPGAEIPPGSLVAGVPAAVRRSVSEAEKDSLARTPPSYRERADRYRAVAKAVDRD
jgi:carbonic anhydrase/acetyltransferase-like protein (isoleucine patch superfamily)